MKKWQSLLLIAGMISLVSFSHTGCNTSGKSATTTSREEDGEGNGNVKIHAPADDPQPGKSRLIVSFYSRGEGSDLSAYQLFSDYLKRTEAEKNITLTYNAVPWGREGEVDYCFSLSELNNKEQEVFINQLRELLKSHELVHIIENQQCRLRR